MIIIYNNEDILTTEFSIQDNRDKFYDTINLVNELPVRKYNDEDKKWSIPTFDLQTLIPQLRKKLISIKCENALTVKSNIDTIKEWNKAQLKLKNIYNREIKNDNLIKIAENQMNNLRFGLYDYQSVGAYFVYNSISKGSIICDMVGLGKTAQAMSVAEKRMIEKQINLNIVLCASTLKRNWENEINDFTRRSSIVVSGVKSKRKRIYKQSYKYDYLILNYDLLRHDIDLIREFILSRKGYKINLIIDEIQYINNIRAIRSKLTKEISRNCKYSLGLSATLLENSVAELFSSFHAIDERVFGDERQYWGFIKKYVKVDWFGRVIGYKNPAMMKKRMSPYFIRRLKEDVLDELPDRVENNVWIELNSKHKEVYKNVKNKIIEEIHDLEKADKITMANMLAMLIYLNQCVLNTKLIGHKKNISTKTEELIEFLHSVDKKSKIVIFCHFPRMIEYLYDRLNKAGYLCMAMHGNKKLRFSCSIDERVDMVKMFDISISFRILIASDILREGINILSANYLVNFDLLYNPAKIEQRIGRIDRIGNKHKVINIVNIITENTVEENIYKKLFDKKAMTTDIIDEGKTENRLTIRNIKSLFDIE